MLAPFSPRSLFRVDARHRRAANAPHQPGPRDHLMHPILIQIGDSFFLGTYGLMIALGLLVAISLGSWRARRRGLPPETLFDLSFVALVAGFAGARVLYIIVEWDAFRADPMAMILSRTGFVFLGGFVAAAAACIVWIRRRGLPVTAVGDVAVPSLALAHAFGRIGCHLAGCCHGGVCNVPGLGIHVRRHFLPGNQGTFWNAYEAQIAEGLIAPGTPKSLAIWPTQLMESGGLFLLTGLLLCYARVQRRPGRVIALYLAGYAVLRFGLEFLRGDLGRGFVAGGLLSTSQAISLAMLPVAAWIWWWSRDKAPNLAPPGPLRAAKPKAAP